jgi:hypothetical protein
MAEITIENDVPDTHPQKRLIEGVIRDTLRDFAGVWDVLIRGGRTQPWWIVVVRRERDGFKRTLLVDPREQTPDEVGKSLQSA